MCRGEDDKKQVASFNNGLTSWAPNVDTPGGSFGGPGKVVWEGEIPIERIFSFFSGNDTYFWSCPNYEECLILPYKQPPKMKKHEGKTLSELKQIVKFKNQF